jgi:hypothetical protein
MRRPSPVLAEHIDEVRQVIADCGAENPRVFGSVATGQDQPGSDLDLLVSVPEANAWRTWNCAPSKTVALSWRMARTLSTTPWCGRFWRPTCREW